MNRSTKTKFGLAAIAFAAVAGGTALVAVGHHGGTPSGPRAPGAQRRWALELVLRIGKPGGDRTSSFRLDGDLVRTIAAVRPGETDVALELSEPRVGDGGGTPIAAADAEALRRGIARRFWATYRDDGALLRLHFPRDVAPSDRNLLQLVAAELQVVRAVGDARSWTAVERDGAGSYLAAYERDGDVLVKRKLHYIEVADATAAVPPGAIRIEVGGSERRITIDAAGEIAAIEGGDRMGVDVGMGPGQLLAITSTTRLSNPRDATAPSIAGSLERAGGAVETSPVRSHAPSLVESAAREDRSLLEGRTTGAVLAATQARSPDPSLRRLLQALFRQRPAAVETAMPLIRDGASGKLLLDGLGAAGTPPALDALRRIARDRARATSTRVDALGALVYAQRPTVDAMRIPLELVDDADAPIRRAARLMTGALARAGRGDHPAEAAALDAALTSRLAEARDVAERTGLLAALGNSAGSGALAAARAALEDRRPEVRAAALEALRLSDDPSVDGLLAASMAGDPDARVRAAAIFAAGFRPAGSWLEAAQRAATTDPVEHVRAAAVSLLRKHLGASPEIADALARVARDDAKPGVRRLAREALERGAPGRGAIQPPSGESRAPSNRAR